MDAAGDFSSWLRARRDALLITQEDLADTAGLSVRTIRYLESGRTTPRSHTRDAISRALGQLGGRKPAQLPLGPAAFVGRAAVLGVLDGIAAERDSAARVALISGGPGVGKTALAVHWAHQVREMFPGGQLFAGLRGFSGTATPVDADEVLRGFLEALGAELPRRTADCVGLYRTMLAGRRVLVVLDDAADADQVRPLLPAAAGSMAVVTSRRQLAGLITGEGARPVPLGPCPPAEARALLAARVGAARLAREPGATEQLVRLCAGMPLALSMVAARAATHPGFALADLVADLHGSAPAELRADIRTAMSWSVAALSGPAARTFRILGLHPHPDVTAEVVAAADGCGPEAARGALDELAAASLLIERRPGRFAMHDAVHVYAAELAHAGLDPAVQDRVRQQLHRYYAVLVVAAVRVLCPQYDLDDAPPPHGSDAPPPIRDARHALAVLGAEEHVLRDVVRDAARRGEPRALWSLASVLAVVDDRQGRWGALIPLARHAARAAGQLGGHGRHLDAQRLSALAAGRNGDKPTARRRLEHAVTLAGDDFGHAASFHYGLGLLADSDHDHAGAAPHFDRALDAYRRAGDPAGEAVALNAVAWTRLHLGALQVAVEHCRRSLVLHGLAGNVHGEASTLDTFGLALHRIGDHAAAVEAYQAALELMTAVGDRHLESTILEHLGDAREAAGDLVRARADRRLALAILDDISPGKADRLRSRLRQSATGPGPQ